MDYRKLGNTDLDVSQICLGTMTWGVQNSQSDAYEQLDYALSQGVNFIDTAELYAIPPTAETWGKTEQFIGNWLAERKCRPEIILASKVAGNTEGWVDHIRGGPRLNKVQLQQALDDSLQRLQTDYLDLYQIHWPARKANYFGVRGMHTIAAQDVESIEETLEVLDGFVQSGRVRHIGISNETPWGLMEYLRLADKRGWPRVQSVQNPYNLLSRLYEVGLAEMSLREEVGLLAYSPLAFGVLSGKYLHGESPDDARLSLFPDYQRYSSSSACKATQRYAELAHASGLSLAHMSLAYVNTRQFVTTNIIGATTLDQLKENIDSINVTLADDVLNAIEVIHQEIPDPSP